MNKIVSTVLIVIMFCFIGGCDLGEWEEHSYTQEIVDKKIEHDRGGSYYYFVLKDFGMVEVDLRTYKEYMIGDKYIYTFKLRKE